MRAYLQRIADLFAKRPDDEVGFENRELPWWIDQIEQKATKLGKPEVVAACQSPCRNTRDFRRILAACLESCAEPTGDVLNLKEAAAYLGYSTSGLRKVVNRSAIRYSQVGEGPIRFRREWLDDFVAANMPRAKRSPAQKRRQLTATKHGFNPKLLR